MSIYNETISEIRSSVDSILKQTFKDFEFLIVIDNPDYVEAQKLLKEYTDSRIRFFVNEKNIGLAMSMNKLAKVAEGKYLARMDADDIAAPTRLKKEYDYLEKNTDVFLVCTSYHFIDENGETLKMKSHSLSFDLLDKLLPDTNMIHHPTVLIRSEMFASLGGYRDFPCTQDYDLWLRALYAGYEMKKIDEDLLSYRVRENSTWKSNGMRQQILFFYIRELYKQRKRTGTDSYSKENLQQYLLTNGASDKGILKYKVGKLLLLQAKEHIKNKRYFAGVSSVIQGMSKDKFLRKEVWYKIYMFGKLKRYKSE